MTGISEILLLILLILCILIVPRMITPKPSGRRREKSASAGVFTMKMRLAVVLSAADIIISALWTKPWQGQISMFIVSGILPVVLGWSLVWIFSAREK
ncbi:hypothetical protein DespoDRAFT_03467 [Desulfobacter postgatei 2ac9]|uniref:Uncharacterized protein n=2 Tax=Desulfobacter postgatei TaxID=2293 RepID=I5B6W6_9BACT|nr:hypothetical protein DespoDRAFT_03467 [Desulfobacter postgatei 2ac9]